MPAAGKRRQLRQRELYVRHFKWPNCLLHLQSTERRRWRFYHLSWSDILDMVSRWKHMRRFIVAAKFNARYDNGRSSEHSNGGSDRQRDVHLCKHGYMATGECDVRAYNGPLLPSATRELDVA